MLFYVEFVIRRKMSNGKIKEVYISAEHYCNAGKFKTFLFLIVLK
jgi:hypothetical protein